MDWDLYLDFYGVRVRLTSPDANPIENIKRDFSWFASSGGPADIEISAYFKRPEYKILSQRAFWLQRKDGTRIYDIGGRRYVDYAGEGVVSYDYKQEKGEIYSKDINLLHEMTYLLIHSRVGEHLDRKGLHRVHALGLSFEGRGILFLMPMQGGKTTLGLELLKDNRFRLLSDDTPLISGAGEILPFLARVGVEEDSREHFPDRYLRRLLRRQYGPKLLIDIEYFKKKLSTEKIKPAFLFKVERTDNPKSEIRRISKVKISPIIFKNMVIGLGLPQVFEFLVRREIGDFLAKSRVLLSRLIRARVLLKNSQACLFSLGKNGAGCRQTLIDYLTKTKN